MKNYFSKHYQKGLSTTAIILIVLAFAVLAFIIFGGDFFNFGVQPEQGRGVTINEISENPESYYDQQVGVVGQLQRVISARVFILEGEGELINDDIWVVTRNPVPDLAQRVETGILGDDRVQVVGTVRRFIVTDIEQEAGVDLTPDIEEEVPEGEPVIVADTVTILQNGETSQATPTITPAVTPETTPEESPEPSPLE